MNIRNLIFSITYDDNWSVAQSVVGVVTDVTQNHLLEQM